MQFNLSMDITTGLDTTNIFDGMRSKHLCNDKGTHKFSFIVKCGSNGNRINDIISGCEFMGRMEKQRCTLAVVWIIL